MSKRVESLLDESDDEDNFDSSEYEDDEFKTKEKTRKN